jgi:hypothetical protein
MRISTSLPDGKWREVGKAARTFEELGFNHAIIMLWDGTAPIDTLLLVFRTEGSSVP